MLIKTEEFKKIGSLILSSIESNEVSTLTETLELKTEGKTLHLNITNKEYYMSVNFELDHEEEFYATVNANLFLKLVSQVTAQYIELTLKDTYVSVKANGEYKIPLIFDNDHLLELPVINIENTMIEMNISGEILESILNFNSKELLKGTIAKPVQRMFYVDNEGCITFTSGACVNSFTLEQPIQLLLNQRTVKLFKLFKNQMVKFTFGVDPISETLSQTKIRFEIPGVTLTVITNSDEELLRSVPVNAIRGRASYDYPYQVTLSRQMLGETINRLLLFSSGYGNKQNIKPYSSFEFGVNSVVIYDSDKQNKETLAYQNDTTLEETYSLMIDLVDFKTVLDGCNEDFVTLKFGNGQCIVVVRGQISNIIPEVKSL